MAIDEDSASFEMAIAMEEATRGVSLVSVNSDGSLTAVAGSTVHSTVEVKNPFFGK